MRILSCLQWSWVKLLIWIIVDFIWAITTSFMSNNLSQVFKFLEQTYKHVIIAFSVKDIMQTIQRSPTKEQFSQIQGPLYGLCGWNLGVFLSSKSPLCSTFVILGFNATLWYTVLYFTRILWYTCTGIHLCMINLSFLPVLNSVIVPAGC